MKPCWIWMMTTGVGMTLAFHADVRGQDCLEFDPFDLNSDGVIDPIDAGFVLSRLGCVVGAGDSECDASDINRDGFVDPLDSGAVLSRFGCERVMFNGRFFENPEIRMGTSVEDLAGADLNGDGLRDLISADGEFDQIQVYLNRGLYRIAVPDAYPVEGSPTSIVVADFDQDGDQDLAASAQDNQIHVLYNDASGGFDDTENSPIATIDLNFQAAADIDADGDLDLISNSRGSIAIARNTGQGAFVDDLIYKVDGYGLVVLDLDANGALDILFARPNEGTIEALHNHGDGTYSQAKVFDVGTYPDGVIGGDFDGDSLLDLAVSDGNGTGDQLVIARNTGTGSFEIVSTLLLGGTIVFALAEDVNRDRAVDLVVGRYSGNYYYGDYLASVLINEGQGTFTEPSEYHSFSPNSELSLCDIDGDGWVELTGSSPWSGFASFLMADMKGGFESSTEFGVGYGSQDITSADLDGDGYAELVTSGSGLSILWNLGSGVFDDYLDISGLGDHSAAADLDGDGDIDLAATRFSYDTLYVYLNNGTGNISVSLIESTGDGPEQIAAGDLNGDGLPELVVVNHLANTISVYVNLGGGHFTDHQDHAVGISPVAVALTDLDKDQDVDILVTNGGSPDFSVVMNQGGGALASEIRYPVSGGGSGALAIADFNGDDNVDMAVSVDGSGEAAGHLSLLFNSGDGTFDPEVAYPFWPVGNVDYPTDLAAGDIDQDGDIDLFIVNSFDSNLLVLRNNGLGTFHEDLHYGLGSMPLATVLDDFDMDGDLDAAVVNSGNDSVSLLLNRSIP